MCRFHPKLCTGFSLGAGGRAPSRSHLSAWVHHSKVARLPFWPDSSRRDLTSLGMYGDDRDEARPIADTCIKCPEGTFQSGMSAFGPKVRIVRVDCAVHIDLFMRILENLLWVRTGRPVHKCARCVCAGGQSSLGDSQAVLWTPTAANASMLCSACPGSVTKPVGNFRMMERAIFWGVVRRHQPGLPVAVSLVYILGTGIHLGWNFGV